MISFGSDNHAGVHPRILEAIAKANRDHCPAYGDDPYTEKAKEIFRGIFGDADVFFVFNGTGANILGLKTITGSYHSILCADTAHIHVDECGAPEKATGCKLITVGTPDGKLTPEMILPRLHVFGNQHHSQPKVISISQPTELGTLYRCAEIERLADLAHSHGMYLHVDGSRFGNAVAALGYTPKACSADLGVDVLSFGGTKNGMLMGEAVLFFNKKMAERAVYERKQLAQLFSKMRFVAAQFEAYLQDGLWLEMAAHSNAMATLLAREVSDIGAVRITQSVETNGVFASLPEKAIDELLKKHCFYIWNEQRNEVRWMTAFDTREEDVLDFAEDIKNCFT